MEDLPDVVKLVEGPGGLSVLAIRSGLADADVFLLGAQITHWQPNGAEPVIFLSEKSEYSAGKPIRGGVPICFPWFGPRAGESGHGFVRNQVWELSEVSVEEGGVVQAVFSTSSTPETLKRWPYQFRARMIYRIGATLEMALEVENAGPELCEFEEALHTYFVVGDVHRARVIGLDGAEYRDFPDRSQLSRQDGDIDFTCETDRVFVNTCTTCVLEDPSMSRRIIVEKSGSNSTTVWNPWIAKSAALADFGDDEWKRMVCIETMNAFENSIALAPGETHRITAKVSVEARS